ncbi:MAG: OsmC family protein [Bacteroidia bacterium]
MKRSATAHWEGTGKEGKGHLSTQSNVLSKSSYAYVTRFENEAGTNPEELLAAAHAGCFTMKLSFNFTKAGFTPESIDTKCEVTLDAAKGEITNSELSVTAKVPGISKEKFDELVADAKANCPVSKLFKAEISCNATLA